MGGVYRKLDVTKTIETIDQLRLRIGDRFPDSGLFKVCGELREIATHSNQTIRFVSRPIYWLRIGFGFLILAGLITLVYSFTLIDPEMGKIEFVDLVQAAESSVNDLIFIGAAIYFLFRTETIMKRKRALKDLHELRTIAHVIDMHQLTKDPKSLNANGTQHSPKREMNNYELSRYLDYCSEMLSLTSKVSALYANDYNDEVVLNTINEIEDLTTSLSGKVWQKIMILKSED
jgi:hypothetical protein